MHPFRYFEHRLQPSRNAGKGSIKSIRYYNIFYWSGDIGDPSLRFELKWQQSEKAKKLSALYCRMNDTSRQPSKQNIHKKISRVFSGNNHYYFAMATCAPIWAAILLVFLYWMLLFAAARGAKKCQSCKKFNNIKFNSTKHPDSHQKVIQLWFRQLDARSSVIKKL